MQFWQNWLIDFPTKQEGAKKEQEVNQREKKLKIYKEKVRGHLRTLMTLNCALVRYIVFVSDRRPT